MTRGLEVGGLGSLGDGVVGEKDSWGVCVWGWNLACPSPWPRSPQGRVCEGAWALFSQYWVSG